MNLLWLKTLPWKWIGLGLGVLLIVVAITIGVKAALDDAYERGEKSGKAEIQARWNAETAGRATARAELSSALVEGFHGLGLSFRDLATQINKSGDTILVQAGKEMANDPRYLSADCSLTDSVRAQVDAARGLSRSTTAAAGGSGSVSASGAVVRLDLGEPGQR